MLTFYGSEIWRFPVGQPWWDTYEDAGKHEGGVAAGDLDGDGNWEILTTDWIGNVYAVNAQDGTQKWHYKGPNEIWSGILICDFNGDGVLDTIVEPEGNESTEYPYGLVALLSPSGDLEAAYPEGLTASTPSVGDFDNDGKIELVGQAWGEPIRVLTMDGAYNPSLVPWGYKYKTASNHGVYSMPESLLVLSAIGLLSLAIRTKKR